MGGFTPLFMSCSSVELLSVELLSDESFGVEGAPDRR